MFAINSKTTIKEVPYNYLKNNWGFGSSYDFRENDNVSSYYIPTSDQKLIIDDNVKLLLKLLNKGESDLEGDEGFYLRLKVRSLHLLITNENVSPCYSFTSYDESGNYKPTIWTVDGERNELLHLKLNFDAPNRRMIKDENYNFYYMYGLTTHIVLFIHKELLKEKFEKERNNQSFQGKTTQWIVNSLRITLAHPKVSGSKREIGAIGCTLHLMLWILKHKTDVAIFTNLVQRLDLRDTILNETKDVIGVSMFFLRRKYREYVDLDATDHNIWCYFHKDGLDKNLDTICTKLISRLDEWNIK